MHLRWCAVGMVSLALTASLLAMGCAPPPPEDSEPDGTEPNVATNAALSGGTVADALNGGCSTASVKGLSQQIIDEMQCMKPGLFVAVPSEPNLSVEPQVFAYLLAPARDHLIATLAAHPGTTMTVTSMYRTIAQQYLLATWHSQGRCGISAAAPPGESNHETGLAIDVSNHSTWYSSLSGHSFHWLGSFDPVHFDYQGTGAVDQRGLDVEAFQRLWNRNHASDTIAEDGDFGPASQARLRESPASGFAIGSSCQP
jgi:hypothetical protein